MNWFAKFVSVALCAVGTALAGESVAEPAGWRNDGSGHYAAANPRTDWSAQDGVSWKAEVGKGTSSPVVSGDRLFLTAEPDVLLCLDARTGKELWRKTHNISAFPAAKDANHPLRAGDYGNANPTPVGNGSRVWAVFGTGIVACHGRDGEEIWVNWFDVEQTTDYARTASPILAGDRLVVHPGPLLCLDAPTGKLLWQNDSAAATYGTPARARIGGTDVVITPGGQVVQLADGKTLASDVGRCMYTSPIVQGNTVYFVDTSVSAVELSQTAAGVAAKELWYRDLSGEFFASPILQDGRLYAVNRDANLFVLDAKTGKTLLEKTLELPPAGRSESPSIYPSLCYAGGRLFIGNDAGEWLVMEAGDKGAASRRSLLPDGSGATPTFDRGRTFARGGKFLFCVGRAASEP